VTRAASGLLVLPRDVTSNEFPEPNQTQDEKSNNSTEKEADLSERKTQSISGKKRTFRENKSHFQSFTGELEQELERIDVVPFHMQSFARNVLRKIPPNDDETITLCYRTKDNRKKSIGIQIIKRNRARKETASNKSRSNYVARVANSIIKTARMQLGSNDDELTRNVFNKIAEKLNLRLIDLNMTPLTHAEMLESCTKFNISVTKMSQFAYHVLGLRPELKGIVFPTQIKQGMCALNKSRKAEQENLENEASVAENNDESNGYVEESFVQESPMTEDNDKFYGHRHSL
jgi:hypothetical protein